MNVGSFQDPSEVEGLAHFLEHSKKSKEQKYFIYTIIRALQAPQKFK